MQRADIRSLVALVSLTLTAACLTAFMPSRSVVVLRDRTIPRPVLHLLPDGHIAIDPVTGYDVRYTLDGSDPNTSDPLYTEPLRFAPDRRHSVRLQAIPTSIQWRHPSGSFPAAAVVKACLCDTAGHCGSSALYTVLDPLEVGLPVMSIATDPSGFFSDLQGIYVPGFAVFDQQDPELRRYLRDQKWWKYPGNYNYRGSRWEREALMQAWSREPGPAPWNGTVHLRINGNTTRGFPQHALRVEFTRPVRFPGMGTRPRKELVLRAAGNDQDRAFMRDVLQHRLCAGMPFITSGGRSMVVFVNGAYWGIHHVRERIEEEELALRYGLRKKDITILADRALLYRGDEMERREFLKLVRMAESTPANDPQYAGSIEARLDVEDFLQYMSAQIILGNSDWPDQNVKYWKFTGTSRPVRGNAVAGVKDGRWRFIMGDSDLGMGGAMWADHDMFAHIKGKRGPVARLYLGIMRSATFRARFAQVLAEQLNGPLSAEAMIAEVDRMAEMLADEMPRHIARWRRPLTLERWTAQVETLRVFARQRGAVVRRQCEQHFVPKS